MRNNNGNYRTEEIIELMEIIELRKLSNCGNYRTVEIIERLNEVIVQLN